VWNYGPQTKAPFLIYMKMKGIGKRKFGLIYFVLLSVTKQTLMSFALARDVAVINIPFNAKGNANLVLVIL
jgi:hypothetical protein